MLADSMLLSSTRRGVEHPLEHADLLSYERKGVSSNHEEEEEEEEEINSKYKQGANTN